MEAEGERPHQDGWPWNLNKSINDDYCYLLGLRSGLVIRYSAVVPQADGEWAELQEPELIDGPVEQVAQMREFGMSRGLAVRVSEIVWVLDAPS